MSHLSSHASIPSSLVSAIEPQNLKKFSSLEGPDWKTKFFGISCSGSEPSQEELDSLEEKIMMYESSILGAMTPYTVVPFPNGKSFLVVYLALKKNTYEGIVEFKSASEKDDYSRVTVTTPKELKAKQGDQFIVDFNYKSKTYSVLFYCNRKTAATLKTTSWPQGLPQLSPGLKFEIEAVIKKI